MVGFLNAKITARNDEKFSSHLVSPQLNVKKKWNGPILSSLVIISYLTFCQYFGVFLTHSNPVNASSRSYSFIPLLTFFFPLMKDMLALLANCFCSMYAAAAKMYPGELENLLS